MAVNEAARIYDEHVRLLPIEDRLRLLALIADDIAESPERPVETPRHSILELHGMGKELWQGIDAQEYVNRLRDEWDERTP